MALTHKCIKRHSGSSYYLNVNRVNSRYASVVQYPATKIAKARFKELGMSFQDVALIEQKTGKVTYHVPVPEEVRKVIEAYAKG